jgi:hypothetical protein
VPQAGDTIRAVQIPGQLVAHHENTSDSAGFTPETVVMTLADIPMISGQTYSVWSNPGVVSTQDGDKIRVALREDSISGAVLDSTMVDSNQAGSATTRKYAPVLFALYPATVTGGKTFVVTGERAAGGGTVHLEGSAERRSYLLVRYEFG